MQKIYKIRIVFSCLDSSIGQENTFYAVRKMVIDSKLPFEPAKVNKLWPRMVYGPSLAQNHFAVREYLDIYLLENLPIQQIKEALERVAPVGLKFLSIQRVPYPIPSVQNLCAAISYRIKGNFEEFSPLQTIEEFVNAEKNEVSYQTEKGLFVSINIRPYVVKAETLSANEIRLTLQPYADRWIKPEWIVAGWLNKPILGQELDKNLNKIQCVRENLFWKDSQNNLHII